MLLSYEATHCFVLLFSFQLVISDVHFRYEDASTKESLPFAFGITINKLSAQSTNENWVSAVYIIVY